MMDPYDVKNEGKQGVVFEEFLPLLFLILL
jgi:hypothetical protein